MSIIKVNIVIGYYRCFILCVFMCVLLVLRCDNKITIYTSNLNLFDCLQSRYVWCLVEPNFRYGRSTVLTTHTAHFIIYTYHILNLLLHRYSFLKSAVADDLWKHCDKGRNYSIGTVYDAHVNDTFMMIINI